MWITPSNLKSSYNQHLSTEDCAKSASKVLFDFGKEASIKKWKNKSWGGFLTFLDPSVYEPFLDEYVKSIESALDHAETQSVMSLDASAEYYDLPLLNTDNTDNGYYLMMSVEMFIREVGEEYVSTPPKGWITPIVTDHCWVRLNQPMKEHPQFTQEKRNTERLSLQMFWESKLYKTHEVNPRWIEALMGLPSNWVRPKGKLL